MMRSLLAATTIMRAKKNSANQDGYFSIFVALSRWKNYTCYSLFYKPNLEVLLNFAFGYKWEWKEQKPNAPPGHSRYSTCVQLTRECWASVDVPVETTKK